MSYDASGIQQEGRFFEIGEETASGKGEYGQGAGGKVGRKKVFWKYGFTCENCGKQSPGRSSGGNRFCQQSCQHEWVVNKWLNCSKCHAAIGLGSQTSGKLLKLSPGNVSRGWKQRGIVANRPECGSWATWAKAKATESKQPERHLWRKYELAWMGEIRDAGKGFEWGILWFKHKAQQKENQTYYTPESQYERACYRSIWLHGRQSIYPDWSSIWYASRLRMTPQKKAVDNMRSRLRALIKTARKGGYWLKSEFIGCTTEQLAKHLESTFTKGMSWDNYGTYWHVDHILPCASFDHRDPKQVKQCWHWTNLRALEAQKNLDKSDLITEPQMQLLLCATH